MISVNLRSLNSDLGSLKLIPFSHCKMTPYTKIEEFAEILSDSLSRFQPFYHGVFNQDNILNGLCQNSHRSFIANTLHKLLNSVTKPAREFMVRVGDF